MKRKAVSMLVTGLIMVALAGCGGAKTEATEQIPESNEIVDTDDLETEADVDTEDEILDSEVVGDYTDETEEFAGTEDENIVLYAEIAKYGDYEGQKDNTFETANYLLITDENVPIYNGDGIEVGYVKSGSTVSVTESGLNAWARFENPIAGTDYDYLYVLKDYVTDGNLITITTADAETVVKEELAKRTFDAPIFTSVTNDMEMYEFRIRSVYEDATDFEITGPTYEVDSYLMQRNNNIDEEEPSIRSYKTYAVVCSEDIDGYIICQIYYKDNITDEEFLNYTMQ